MNPISDREKAKDITQNTCVSASAGTGKTTLLAERYAESLKALLKRNKIEKRDNTNKFSPSNILCLTFTDKAAAEIREKIEKNLRKGYEKTKKNGGKENFYEEAINDFHLCRISTFHGFCSSLLQEYPFDANIQPGFAIMDEIDTKEMVDSEIERFLSRPPEKFHSLLVKLYLYSNKFDVIRNIRTLLVKWRSIQPWYQKFLENPEDVYNEVLDAYRNYIREQRDSFVNDEKINIFIQHCTETIFSKRCTSFPNLINNYQNFKNAETGEEILEIASIIRKANIDSSKKKNIPDNSSITEEDINYYNREIKNLDFPLIYPFNDEKIQELNSTICTYCEITEYLFQKIEDKKRRSGLVNFDDLIVAAKNLMHNEEIAQRLRERFQYILVDEVQDNDPALTEIVTILAKETGKSKNNLFIVGDIKQSIYKFRGADPDGALAYFNTFEHRYELGECFRSLKPIIDKVNQVFTKVFPSDSEGLSYNGVEFKRDGTHGSVQIIQNEAEKNASRNDYSKQDSINESIKVASWIRKTIDSGNLLVETDEGLHPATFGDIVILMDRRTRLPEVTDALDSFGVPYREYKGRAFYSSQEVNDITNVLRALIYKEDDIALFGALISPYFGIPVEKLADYPIEKGYLYQCLENSDDEDIKEAIGMLDYYRKLLETETLGVFLHQLIRESGVISVYSAGRGGEGKIANITKYLDIASGKSSKRALTMYEFLHLVDTSIQENVQEEEGDSSEEGDEANVVKIMTVHASKGLQFPIVILMYSGRGMKEVQDNFFADNTMGIGINQISYSDATVVPSYSYILLKAKTIKDVEDERKRLFYVAATRARDHLIISETEYCGTFIPTSYMKYYRMGVSPKEDTFADATIKEANKIDFNIHKEISWNPVKPESFKQEERIVVDEETRRKMNSGSCMHEIFEGKDPHEACIRYGIPAEEERFTREYNEFLSSELMKDVVESYCEIPIITEDGENKRIDRLVRKADGTYLIIDYKEGQLSDQKEDLMEKYRGQLTAYAKAASKIFHQDVSAYLYFAGDSSIVQIV